MALKKPIGLERIQALWPSAPQRLLRLLLLLGEIVAETLRGFRADRGADLASSLSFATMITAVPLLATFSLFLATFFQENVGTILEVVNAVLPYHTARVTDSLREFIHESTAISGIGLVILLVASVRLIFTVEGVFNAVWGAPRRSKLMSRAVLYTVVLFALAMLVGGLGFWVQLLRRSPLAGIVSSRSLESFSPIVSEFVGLTLLYRFLPNALVGWSPAAIAGATVTALLELLHALLALYVKALARVNLVTGSLTLILLTLVSLFLAWALILLGVELTHVIQTGAAQRRLAGGPRAGRAENAVRMLLRLAGGGVHAFRDLYREQEASSDEAQKILDCLRESELIEGDGGNGFALKRSPEKITISEIVEAISPNLYSVSPEEKDRVVEVLEPLFKRLDAERRWLLGTTIAQLRSKNLRL